MPVSFNRLVSSPHTHTYKEFLFLVTVTTHAKHKRAGRTRCSEICKFIHLFAISRLSRDVKTATPGNQIQESGPTEGSLLTNLFSKNTDWQSAPLCCYPAIRHSVSHINPREAAFQPWAFPKMVMNPEEIFILHSFKHTRVIGPRRNHEHVNLITPGLIQGQVWRHERSAWRQALRYC